MASDAVALVRQEWDEGHRALEHERSDRTRYRRLLDQLEVVTDELRKRIGQTFTLDQLAVVYQNADDWARAAVSERAATPGWPRTLAIVLDAAFHLYQRGAVDYTP